jgi:hypothetical protein
MKSVLIPGLLAALMTLLSACSQTPPAPAPDYLLPGASHSGHTPLRIHVTLASYLDQGGIVLQLSNTELHVARQHRWAEPLGSQLQRAMAATLASQATLSEQGKLALQISRFQGVQNAEGHVAGSPAPGSSRQTRKAERAPSSGRAPLMARAMRHWLKPWIRGGRTSGRPSPRP